MTDTNSFQNGNTCDATSNRKEILVRSQWDKLTASERDALVAEKVIQERWWLEIRGEYRLAVPLVNGMEPWKSHKVLMLLFDVVHHLMGEAYHPNVKSSACYALILQRHLLMTML